MGNNYLAVEPSALSDEELEEVCLETPSASNIGLPYHLEKQRRVRRRWQLVSMLSFWAACAASLSLAMTIFLLLSK